MGSVALQSSSPGTSVSSARTRGGGTTRAMETLPLWPRRAAAGARNPSSLVTCPTGMGPRGCSALVDTGQPVTVHHRVTEVPRGESGATGAPTTGTATAPAGAAPHGLSARKDLVLGASLNTRPCDHSYFRPMQNEDVERLPLSLNSELAGRKTGHTLLSQVSPQMTCCWGAPVGQGAEPAFSGPLPPTGRRQGRGVNGWGWGGVCLCPQPPWGRGRRAGVRALLLSSRGQL